jgi:hypothetical protein
LLRFPCLAGRLYRYSLRKKKGMGGRFERQEGLVLEARE